MSQSTLVRPKFDINKLINRNDNIAIKEEEPYVPNITFRDVVNLVKNHFHQKIQNGNLTDQELNERQRIEHAATLGDPKAATMLIEEIESLLREKKLTNVQYPNIFRSLSHAVFEHIFRFKEFYKWTLYPESPSAKIVGKEIWFKINGTFVKQEEEFESIEETYQIIRLLQQTNPNLKINEKKPQAEFDLMDGTRVTMTIPPRTLVPTIVFRRFIVKKFSFEEQANKNTIAKEDVPLFQCLAKVPLNIVIAGPVESGKSTMLKTFFAERPKELVAILIEEHPESYLKRDFPDRLTHEFFVRDSNIAQVIRTSLRFDHDYVIWQEVRGIEADAAIDGANRGATGLLMTYHVTEEEKIAEQLAQHIVDAYPNRKYVNEVRRVAQTLHLGVTMKNLKDNTKKVISVFEFCYDYEKDEAWINFLLKYNLITKKWEYNNNVSRKLLQKLIEFDAKIADEFLTILSERYKAWPMKNPVRPILFKDGGR